MALEFLLGGRPFPADRGSLTIERRLNGCPTAKFRARIDAPRLLTGAHLVSALSPFAGEAGRSDAPEGGAIQSRDLTAEGFTGAIGLSTTRVLEDGVQVARWECRLVDEHGLPLADTEHHVKVGDLLLFFRSDGFALLNQALPVVYVRAGRGSDTGAVRVARPEGGAFPESFPDVVRWRHATGNDVVSVERLATPARLTNLTAAAGDGRASLAWDELTGMSGYEYRYRRGAAPWGDAAAFPAGTRTGGTVTGLENGVLYTFQVRGFISAADGKLVGAWASVGVIPSAAPAFSADQHDLQFFIGQAKTVTLPRLLGGELPYAYSVRPALPAGLRFTAPTTPDGSPSIGGTPAGSPSSGAFTLQGSDGTGDVLLDTFQIHVAAANANVQPYFVDQSGPDVELIQGTAVGGSGVLPGAVSGNAPVVHSIVETLPDGVTFDAAAVRLTGTPSAAAPAGTYTLRATDADGEHTDLSFRITVVAPSTGPGRPVWGAIPDVTLVAGRQARHVLPAPAGGAPPIGYALRGAALPAGLSLNGLTITGVPKAAAPRTRYTVVATASGAGTGVAQTFHLAVAAATARPGAPAGLTSTGGQNRQVTVQWSNPGAPAPTHVEYQLQAGGTGAFGNRTRVPYPPNHTLVITGLGVGVAYVARIVFVNAAGTGAAADAPSAATLGRPTAITNIRQTAARRFTPSAAITIGWAHDGTRSITGFQYRYRRSGAAAYGDWNDVAGGATARSVTIDNLPFAYAYDVQLQAVNAAGATPSGRIQAYTPPTRARNTRLARPSQSAPNDWVVSWDAPVLPAGIASTFITGYRVLFAYGPTEAGVDGSFHNPATLVQRESDHTYPATDRSATIRHQPIAGQYYRAWVYVAGPDGWASGGNSSPVVQIPARSQHAGGQAQSPQPTAEHRPADAPPKQAQQSAALPAPAWIGAVVNAPNAVDVRWAAVAGAAGYQYRVNVTNERGARQSTHVDWTTVPGDAPSLVLAALNGVADAYYAVEVRASGSTESITAERFGPWRTSWNGEHPVLVTTAKPHGLALDPDGGTPPRVQFRRLFGSDDFDASGSDGVAKHMFPLADVPSDTSFTVQSARFLEEAPPTGERNPEWRQALTAETVSKPNVPEPRPLRDEVIIHDTEAGPAEPLLGRGSPRADWWNVARVGARVYWATEPTAPHGLADGEPVILTTGDADYDGRPLGARVGALPDELSGLPGFSAANTFAFDEDADDPFNLADVIRTAAPRTGPFSNQITRITGAGDRKTLHVRATTGLSHGSIVRLVGVTGVDSLNRYPAVQVSATTIVVSNPGGPLAIAPDTEAHWEAYTRTTSSWHVIRSLGPRGLPHPGVYRVDTARGVAPAVGRIVQFEHILLDGAVTQKEFIVTSRGPFGAWFEIVLRDSSQSLEFQSSLTPHWHWREVLYTAVPLPPRTVLDAVSSVASSSRASPAGGHAWTLGVADTSPYRAYADGSGGQADDGWVCLPGMLHGGHRIPPTARFPVLAKTASTITVGRLPQTGVTRGDLTAAGVTGLGTAPLALPVTGIGAARYQPLERARLFAGVVWSVRWEVAAGANTAWYHLECLGHAHVLDHRLVRDYYETPPDATIRGLAKHLVDTWVNPYSPTDRQIAAADATLYVTGPAKADVWDWIPASEALTRLLDHQAAGIDGYWYVDEFRRLIVSQRAQPTSAAPLVLRQGRHIDGGAVTVDPARLVTVQTVVGFVPEAANQTEYFSTAPDRTAAPPVSAIRTAADGRQFVQLAHRPASVPAVRRAVDGGTVDESVTEDPAAPGAAPVWILDRARGILTRNTGHAQVDPAPAGSRVTVDYVYSEPTVVTTPAGADHATLRDASPAVKAYGVLHRVHQDAALDDLARTQAAADALLARNAFPARYADLVLLPDDPSIIRLREGQIVDVQAPALGIGRTGTPERPDAAQPARKWLVESITIDIANDKPRLGCRLLARDWHLPPGAPLAAPRRLVTPTRSSTRPHAPGAVTDRTQTLEGVRLPHALGGAWGSSNTSNAPDGARIAGGAVFPFDGSRFLPRALHWRAMAQTFGDAVIELFLWDVDAGARVAGSTLSSISTASPAHQRKTGFALAPEVRRYELRCRLTAPATPNPRGGDEAWIWAAELSIGRTWP